MFNIALFCMTTIGTMNEAEVSRSIGHMIGKTLQKMKVPLNMEEIAKGIEEEEKGILSPMTEEECATLLEAIEKENQIQEANTFFASLEKEAETIALVPGKLHYKILKKGVGETVQSYNSPLIRLKEEGMESIEKITPLDELIPGLKIGILGMEEGEIRKFYIHPDLGYEKSSPLLIFEVEVIQADAAAIAETKVDESCPF